MAFFGREKRLLKKYTFTKLHLNKSQDLWNNDLRTDETSVELFGHNAQHHMW